MGDCGQRLAIGVGCAVALALAPLGPGAWDQAAAQAPLLSAGGVGQWLWAGAASLGGWGGMSALRALFGLLMVTVLLSWPSEDGRVAWPALMAACLLLPWGPGAASPLLASVCALPSRGKGRWLLPAVALGAWPALDPAFWIWIPFLPWAGRGLRGFAPAAVSLANPCLWGGIVDGTWLRGPRLLLGGSPEWAGMQWKEPTFWVVVLVGVWTAGSSATGIGLSGRRLWGMVTSLLVRPAAPLVAWQASGPLAPARGVLGAGVVALGLWQAFTPPPPLPSGALALLRTVPAGEWTLETRASWSGELRFRLGQGGGSAHFRVYPGGDPELRVRWMRRTHGRPSPPFLGLPAPEADFILTPPYEPKYPDPASLSEGWSLAGAFPEGLLFVRARGPLGSWTEAHSLQAYRPFGPLPEDGAMREVALNEAMALAESSPGFFEANRDSGRMLIDLGQRSSAERFLRKAIDLRPGAPQVWNDLGVALSGAGRFSEAEAAFRKSISFDPGEVVPRLNLASMLISAGRHAEARRVLEDVLGMAPGLPPAIALMQEVDGASVPHRQGGAP